jgi:uncharacterized protein YbjT (DUF2867 family)
MQEYLREAPIIVHEAALYLPLADVKLNPIDLADVAKVAFRLLRDGGHEGARLHLTGPEALTMTEIAERISTATGRTVRYVPITREQRRNALINHGIQAAFSDALDEQVEERLRGGLESTVDVSVLKSFGVTPTTFLEFARANAQSFGAVPATA